MKKNHIAFRMWGGITVLLVLVSLIACAENSRTPDDTSSATEYTETDASSTDSSDTGSGSSSTDGKTIIDDYSETVEVSISSAGSSDPLAPKSLTATPGSYSTATELYWTYTAVKADSYFSTGQTSSETWLSSSTDEDGNVTVSDGLPESLPGKFSVGAWVFTFNAYTSADMSDENLFYRGIATSKTLTTSDNTVSVNVQLVEAEGDYGTLVVYGITFTNLEGETQTLSDITLWYSIDSGTLTEDADQAMLSSSADDGLIFEEEIEAGYHTFYACVTDTSGNVLASGSASAVVKPNLTTTITGDIEEDESATTSVTLGDLSVSYGSISVSSEAGLTAALADSEVSTVVLSEEIEISSYLSITSDTTIDLNGNDLEASSYAFLVSNGASLTITDDSDEAGTVSATYYTVYFTGTGGSLTVESGTLSSTSGYAVLVYGTSTEADITISGGTISSAYDAVVVWGDEADITITGGTVSSDYGAAIWVYSGDSNITISGGTLSAENDSAIYVYDGDSDITITGGELSGDIGVSILNTVDSADITISGGTITGSSYALTVNGLVTSDTPVTLTVTDGELNGLVYLAGYCTTAISGGTFTSDVMQALHMRSGSLNVTGGTFKGTHPENGYDYEYIYAGGGSAALYGDIVVEASSGYPLLSAAVAGSGVSLQDGDYYGIHYYLDPEYDDSTPELEIDDSLNYTAHTGLIYSREVTEAEYEKAIGWRLYYSDPDNATATTYTVTIYGEDYTLSLGDLEVQDSSSSTGWSTYSSSEE